jgi:hypothetical protein
VANHVAACQTFKDACLLSGVAERTGLRWLSDGERAYRTGADVVPGTYTAVVLQFWHLIEGAKARRRSTLKLIMRRSATGTPTKPGDWRAAHTLGAIADADEFVIEQRVKFSMERKEALDRLEEAFIHAPAQLTREDALDLALLAIAGRGRADPVPAPAGEPSGGGGGADHPGSGEAVQPTPAAPEAAHVP